MIDVRGRRALKFFVTLGADRHPWSACGNTSPGNTVPWYTSPQMQHKEPDVAFEFRLER